MPTVNPATTQKRTALELLNTVLGEVGMPLSASILSSDDTMTQLLYLANGLGSRVAQLPFWASLIETWEITTTTATEYDLPADWGVPTNGTAWDRSGRWPLIGPVGPIGWQYLKSGFGVAAPQYRYRFIDEQMVFFPAPIAGLTVVHEYQSTGWVLGLDGALATQRKPRITADSDYILLSEEMFICGVKLVWLEAKGLDSSKALVEFLQMLEAGWAASNGAPIVSFVPTPPNFLITQYNLPDTGYGQ